MAALQHRLSKTGGESFPPFHAVTVNAIRLCRESRTKETNWIIWSRSPELLARPFML